MKLLSYLHVILKPSHIFMGIKYSSRSHYGLLNTLISTANEKQNNVAYCTVDFLQATLQFPSKLNRLFGILRPLTASWDFQVVLNYVYAKG